MPRKSKEELKNKILNLLNIENKKDTSKDTAKTSKKDTAKKADAEVEKKNTKKTSTAKPSTSKKTSPSKSTTTKSTTKKTTATKSANKKAVADKAVSTKKSASKSTAAKKSDTSKANSSTTGKTSTSKKVSTSKTVAKISTATKSSAEAKSTTKKASTKKATNSKSSSKKAVKKELATVEYYDLPYRYNETVVKILAQTPNMLFIYWDISDDDRNSYIEKYGENFFNTTKPVLIITNRTMNYSFEVEINDFANSWYLHINDADCDYAVELGRRPIEYNSNIDNYVYITTSNDMQMPNDHILFDKLGKSVFFKNTKNNFIEEKEISSITFIKSLGKVYDIYELYKELYNGEIDIEDLAAGNIKLNLSSSNSSTFK